MKLTLYVISLLLGASVLSSATKNNTSPAEIIQEALTELMTRGQEAHPWVIFTDVRSQQFVQFGYEQGNLFIDIPLIKKPVSEENELERIFKSVGIESPISVDAQDPKTFKTSKIRTYQAHFDHDTKRAASFALQVFREAFKIESPALKVETGSG